ncbi:MAG: prepilin-type N-terminal cleavage/methylation domain-containing protein [Oscillospiraceae bacterium]
MKNKLQKAKANNKGFTLVELIVVIAILGVLMAVLVPQYIQYVEKSKEGTDKAVMGEILHAANIEAALVERDATVNVTIAVDANGKISVTPAAAGKATPLETAISDVIGTEGSLKSKDGRKLASLVIEVKSTGAADWSGAAKTALQALDDGKATK